MSKFIGTYDSYCRLSARTLFSLLPVLLLSLSACSANHQVRQSRALMDAITHNQNGISAEASGNNQMAIEEFAEALRINSSIENETGKLVALVNLSRIYRHNGDAKKALEAINTATSQATPASPLFPEVAFEKAQAELLSGCLEESARWAKRAFEAEKTDKLGARINLLARILYMKGDLPGSEENARKALKLNRGAAATEEEANSLRTLGDIEAATDRMVEAAANYVLALDIDKQIGKSRKIALDLRGLAFVSDKLNRPAQALDYYQRAYLVSKSGGDRKGASADLMSLSGIYRKTGNNEQAERLLKEREALLTEVTD